MKDEPAVIYCTSSDTTARVGPSPIFLILPSLLLSLLVRSNLHTNVSCMFVRSVDYPMLSMVIGYKISF